ncbi:MAG: hypothetical protein KGL53_07875, partial [Elusimicrobia bacterium]|nr:hypothetical protein [Elusimicrobiota bacterium]
EAARRLRREGLLCVTAGASGDRALGDAVLAGLGDGGENWAGRTSVLELAGLLAGARLVVSHDTGAAHLAAALGTPLVYVAGGGSHARFIAPYQAGGAAARPDLAVVDHPMDCYGCAWRCVYPLAPGASAPCLAEIPAGRVLEAVQRLLRLTPPPGRARGGGL